MSDEGQAWTGVTPAAPGFAILPSRGEPRPLDPRLLSYLGLGYLPVRVSSLEELLAEAGFHHSPTGEHRWEREGYCIQAGESQLEDGSRLWWVVPVGGGEQERQRQVRYLTLASHDLRGSLANVRSYAELLLKGRIPLEPKVRQRLEVMLRNVDRALAFAQDFFDSSRADLGHLAWERERLRLEPLLERAVARHRAAATEAEVTLELELDQPLPEVEVDGARVQHALESFLRHQLGRAQPGERLRVRAGPASHQQFRVEVRLYGQPLTDEELASLFQREERAFREKKLEDPLRMALARQEVEALGGSVGAVVDEGGTTLYLTLPAALSPSVSLQP